MLPLLPVGHLHPSRQQLLRLLLFHRLPQQQLQLLQRHRWLRQRLVLQLLRRLLLPLRRWPLLNHRNQRHQRKLLLTLQRLHQSLLRR